MEISGASSGKFDKNGNPAANGIPEHGKRLVTSYKSGQSLIVLGLNKGDRVVIFSESRPRWDHRDQAIQACGHRRSSVVQL